MNDKNKSTTDTADDSDRSPQVGALLRASRLRVGEDLRDVSDDLCIRFLYLEAIEECRYEDLPGDTYAIGFIRSYAEHLGLDGEEVIRRYRLERASNKRLSDLSFPTPVPESGVPKGAIVLVGVVLAVVVYGGWYVSTTEDSILSDLISPVPERLQHLVEDENKATDTLTDEMVSKERTTTAASDAPAETSPGVNTETQEALQANTAEAIAEATEAARDSIEDTATSVVDTATETANSVAGTVAAETEAAVEEVAEATSEAAEATAQQATEVVAEVAETAEEVATATEATVSEVVAAATTSEAREESQSSAPTETPDTADPTSGVTVTNADTPAVEVESPPVEQNQVETEASQAVTETTDTSTAPSEETVPEPEAEQVSAEDLNALALQAASGATNPVQTPTTPPVETASTTSSVAPATSSTGVGNSGIVIRAVDNSWVQVADPATGEILFTGLMAPGATFDVPARSGLLLDTGNAGAIDVIVNGTTAPKLGGAGDVRKGIALDGARLIAGTAGN